jgi:hypothetical protein
MMTWMNFTTKFRVDRNWSTIYFETKMALNGALSCATLEGLPSAPGLLLRGFPKKDMFRFKHKGEDFTLWYDYDPMECKLHLSLIGCEPKCFDLSPKGRGYMMSSLAYGLHNAHSIKSKNKANTEFEVAFKKSRVPTCCVRYLTHLEAKVLGLTC